MATVALKVKNSGKTFDVTADLSKPGLALKEAIYQVTGVPAGMQKIVTKGGMLKDDTDLTKLKLAPGQLLQVIGTPGPIPKGPEKEMVFAEDLTDAELASHSLPSGLINEGNTCYMASTVQVLRAVAPLQEAIDPTIFLAEGGQGRGGVVGGLGNTSRELTSSLGLLYSGMNRSTDPTAPTLFLPALRRHNPQFDQMTTSEHMPGRRFHEQQDAQECWASILNALRDTLKVGNESFVQQYMMGETTSEMKIAEPGVEEEPTYSQEPFLELKCNIAMNTNYMGNGIRESLDQEIEKNSVTVNRTALYNEKKRISRLPSFLTVHLVRFAWRRDINKKAKIMRRVQFPLEYDAIDLLSDDLKARIAPVNSRLKEVEKDRRQRANIRNRTKAKREDEAREKKKQEAQDRLRGVATGASTSAAAGGSTDASAATTEEGKDDMVIDEEDEDLKEEKLRKKEQEELMTLCDKDLLAETGACVSAMYELVGVVTHKGASADGGHYVGWVRRDAMNRAAKDGQSQQKQATAASLEKEQWYRFDDERVTVVDGAKILTLAGGGEDHAAYILLYKEKSFA